MISLIISNKYNCKKGSLFFNFFLIIFGILLSCSYFGLGENQACNDILNGCCSLCNDRNNDYDCDDCIIM